MRRLGNNLIVFSVLGVVAAFAWFAIYYTRVMEYVAGPGTEVPVRCLFTSSGDCWMIRGLGSLTGAVPYEPVTFWISCSSLVLGVILRMSSSRKQ